jgi:hypothetical protein
MLDFDIGEGRCKDDRTQPDGWNHQANGDEDSENVAWEYNAPYSYNKDDNIRLITINCGLSHGKLIPRERMFAWMPFW